MTDTKADETIQNDDADFASLNGFMQFENPGDVITGEYLGFEKIRLQSPDGRENVVNQYYVHDAERGFTRFNGTAQMLILARLAPGTRIRVRFRKEEKASGSRRIRLFDIGIEKGAAAAMVEHILATGGIRPIVQEEVPIAALPAGDDGPDPFAEDPKYSA